jgi:hypothetical protein
MRNVKDCRGGIGVGASDWETGILEWELLLVHPAVARIYHAAAAAGEEEQQHFEGWPTVQCIEVSIGASGRQTLPCCSHRLKLGELGELGELTGRRWVPTLRERRIVVDLGVESDCGKQIQQKE